MLASLWQDLAYGWRTLARERTFTAAAALTLALGIGANAAIFGLIDAVLFRPFPVREPDRLAVLYSRMGAPSRLVSTSYPDYLDLRDQPELFDGTLAYLRLPVAFNAGQRTERLSVEGVTASYFDVAGVEFFLGRGFAAGTARTAGDLPVVLAHGLWLRAFGSDPGVVGRPVRVGSRAAVVVAVAPPGFRGLTLDWGDPPQLWFPLESIEDVSPPFRSRRSLEQRDSRMLLVVARLRGGIRVEQAEAALRTRARQLEAAYPATNRGFDVTLLPASLARFWPERRASVVLFLSFIAAVVLLVLLIACANVANLLLARTARRRREIAVRLALGAARGRIVRQLLTESLLLAAAGLVLGGLVALAAIELLGRYPFALQIPITLELGLDRRVLGFGALLAILTTVGFGLAPALAATGADLRAFLQDRTPTGSSRLRSLLVVVQVALSLVLLVGAGLFMRTLQHAASIPTGWNAEGVLLVSVDFNTFVPRDQATGLRFYRDVLERVGRLPGVRSATWGGDVPLAPRQLMMRFTQADQPAGRDEDWITAFGNVVGPRYFETLGIPIVRGRDFTGRDREGMPGVAIVNEAMARRYWRGEEAVGKRITVWRRPDLTQAPDQYEIVGIAANVRQRSLFEETGPYLYLSLGQRYFPEMMLHVRTAGEPLALLPAVRQQISAIDPDLPVFDARTLSDQIATTLSQQRLAAALLGASGGLALLLAVVGVYGLTAYDVAQRSRELGVRIALGARSGDIVALVLRGGVARLGVGVLVGLGIAAAAARSVARYLYGVAPFDPVAFGGIALLLLAVGTLACLVPTLRALRIDPCTALREE